MEAQTLERTTNSPRIAEPLIQFSLTDIDPFEYVFIVDNRTMLIDESPDIAVFKIGQPFLPSE